MHHACALLENDIKFNIHDEWVGILLQYAAREGHFNIIQALLASGIDVNMQGRYYGNALQAASRAGNVAMVDLLLKKGANIHAVGASGEHLNALHAAFLSGCNDVVKLLLQEGASLDSPARNPFDNAVQFACGQSKYFTVAIRLRC